MSRHGFTRYLKDFSHYKKNVGGCVPGLMNAEKWQFYVSFLFQGLSLNFEDVDVSVVECPDLTQEPFNLASKGLCGNSRVLDIGGVPYLVPLAQKNKLYDMKDYPKLTGMSSKDDCLIIGAGAAPSTYLERNAEVHVL